MKNKKSSIQYEWWCENMTNMTTSVQMRDLKNCAKWHDKIHIHIMKAHSRSVEVLLKAIQAPGTSVIQEAQSVPFINNGTLNSHQHIRDGWEATAELTTAAFSFQVKTPNLTTTLSLSPFPSHPLFIQILQTGYFFQFSTFTSFLRERHYASVIMQFITNNRFVYGGPRLSPALSAAFSK